MRSLCFVCALLCVSTFAHAAEYFDERFAPGYELLKKGDFDKALENFEQLKTDTPDSALVEYSIASVAYQMALSLRDNENAEGAIEQFTAAKSQFEALSRSSDNFLREQAPLNAANASAQIAKLYNPEQQYKERVQGLMQALSEYDAFLGRFPDHQVAQRNRDHVSYLLKQLLRNPPPEEEQDKEKESGNNEEQEENEDQAKQDQAKKDSDKGQENEDDSKGEDSEEEETEDDAKHKDDPSKPSDENEAEDSQPQQSENGKSAEEENIEAILESLEATNQEEQKNLRKAKMQPRVKGGKWW